MFDLDVGSYFKLIVIYEVGKWMLNNLVLNPASTYIRNTFSDIAENETNLNFKDKNARAVAGFVKTLMCVWHLAHGVKPIGVDVDPGQGSITVVGSHTSLLDPMAAAFTIRPTNGKTPTMMVSDHLFGVPYVKDLMTMMGVLPVNTRGNGDNKSTLKDASKVLQNGGNVFICPEGWFNRNETNGLMIHDGAALLAIENQVPIFGCVVNGLMRFLSKNVRFITDNPHYRIFVPPFVPNRLEVHQPFTIKFHLIPELNQLLRREKVTDELYELSFRCKLTGNELTELNQLLHKEKLLGKLSELGRGVKVISELNEQSLSEDSIREINRLSELLDLEGLQELRNFSKLCEIYLTLELNKFNKLLNEEPLKGDLNTLLNQKKLTQEEIDRKNVLVKEKVIELIQQASEMKNGLSEHEKNRKEILINKNKAKLTQQEKNRIEELLALNLSELSSEEKEAKNDRIETLVHQINAVIFAYFKSGPRLKTEDISKITEKVETNQHVLDWTKRRIEYFEEKINSGRFKTVEELIKIAGKRKKLYTERALLEGETAPCIESAGEEKVDEAYSCICPA